MVRYDGRGYGYFSLIKPVSFPNSETCPFCGLPVSLCECNDEDPFDYEDGDYDAD